MATAVENKASKLDMDDDEYKELYRAVSEKLSWLGVYAPDEFIQCIMARVHDDADTLWNIDDVTIAIRNEINEMIEKRFNC